MGTIGLPHHTKVWTGVGRWIFPLGMVENTMTCLDCGIEISEYEASVSPMLADVYENIKATGLCIGCEFIKHRKGEVECQTKED